MMKSLAHKSKGWAWHRLLGYYPNGAARPALMPPWGIHTGDPHETHHGAALADDAIDLNPIAPGARGLIQNHLSGISLRIKYIEQILEAHCGKG